MERYRCSWMFWGRVAWIGRPRATAILVAAMLFACAAVLQVSTALNSPRTATPGRQAVRSAGVPTPASDTVPILFEVPPSVLEEDFVDQGHAGGVVVTTLWDEDRRDWWRTALAREMAKYPAEVLRKNLKTVYVVDTLTLSGVRAAGTNSVDAVFVADWKVYDRHPLRRQRLVGAFHHELSSILLRNYETSFSTEEWMKLNPRNFQYLGDGIDAIQQGHSDGRIDPRLFEQGFVCEYGKASLEDDVNTLCEAMLMGDRQVWQGIAVYAPLREKCALIVRLYESIDPRMNAEFFQRLAQ